MYSPKSASTAGILGILLGAFGAHDWYLGNRQKQAKLHIAATVVGAVLFTAVTILRSVASSGQSPETVTLLNNIATVLYTAAWLTTLGSVVWGVVDGVLLLAQGDAGLKARGYYIQNDPDNPLARTLSTTTVRENLNRAQSQPSTPTSSVSMIEPAPRPRVALPSTPTLEQQGSNVNGAKSPIVFRSSDIHQSFQFNNVFDGTANPPANTVQPSVVSQSQPAAAQTTVTQPAVNAPVNSNVTPSAQASVLGQPTSPTQAPAASPAAAPVAPQSTTPMSSPTATPVTPQSAASTPAPAVAPQSIAFMNRTNSTKQSFGTKTVKDVVTKVQRKFTFNPVVTRRIIISISVALFVVIAGFIIKGLFDSTVTTGYGSAYRAGRELSTKLSAVSQTPYCQYVTDYIDDTSVATTTYERYITGCREVLTEIGPLIDKLGEAPAIGWDSNLSASYQEFKTYYDVNFPDSEHAAIMSSQLDLYQSWHSYLIGVSELSAESPDSAITQVADILRNSGDATLAKYGEDWLARELDYAAAARRYAESTQETSIVRDNLRREMEQKRTELQTWVGENLPDLTVIAPIAASNTQSLLRNFTSLYERIKRAYAQNYDHASGDCDDRSGTVYCQ